MTAAASGVPSLPIFPVGVAALSQQSPHVGHPPDTPGTIAASVLLTNLTNLVQPLIRYDLTDSFVEQQPVAATGGHRRVRVEGRRDDAFVYDRKPQAVLVHPLVVRSMLVLVPEIVEYHVQQTVFGISVTAVTVAPVDITAIVERLAVGLRAAGLADPEVRLTLASALPRDRRTGNCVASPHLSTLDHVVRPHRPAGGVASPDTARPITNHVGDRNRGLSNSGSGHRSPASYHGLAEWTLDKRSGSDNWDWGVLLILPPACAVLQ